MYKSKTKILTLLLVTTLFLTAGIPLIIASTQPQNQLGNINPAIITQLATTSQSIIQTQPILKSITNQSGWPQSTGGAVPSSPALGDIDGDGDIEVVVGSTNYKVYAWHHNGTLVDGWPKSTGGAVYSSPALGDIDGDGDIEVVVGSNDRNVYAWHHNGTLVTGWPKLTGDMVGGAPALGDLDSDGDLEIVVGSWDKKVYAWHHNGTEVDGWPKTTSSWVKACPALGDIDGDGDIEVVIGSSTAIHAWHHNGTEVDGWPQSTVSGIDSSAALGDIDGDGDIEIVVGTNERNVYAWHHNGTKVAGWPQPISTAYATYSPALGDIDGDGDIEIVIGSNDGNVYAWHHNGTKVAGWEKTTGGAVYSCPALGDLDGDGDIEVVIGSNDRNVYAWHHNGTTVAEWPQTTGASVRSSPALGDLDEDGDIEVVIGSDDGNVYAWDCSGAYNPANVPWPMFHHDVHHTGLYVHTIWVHITSPAEGEILSSADITVNWNGSSIRGLDHYEIRIDEGSWIPKGTDTSHTFNDLADDLHSVEVKLFDLGGYNDTDSVAFTVDTTSPVVTITYPSDGAMLDTGSFDVTWSSDDTDIAYYLVTVDSALPVNMGLATSYPVSLGDGAHTVNVTAVDLAGFSGWDVVSFTVDATSPVVTITDPSPDEVFSTSSVTVDWTVIEDNLDYCMYRLDGGDWIDVGLDDSHVFTGLSNGSHTVDIMAVDEAGHNTTDTVTFTVNLPIAPALDFVLLLVLMSLTQQQGVPMLYIVMGGAAVAVVVIVGLALWLRRRP